MTTVCNRPTPSPATVALMLEATGLTCTPAPVDTRMGKQHDRSCTAFNPDATVQ